MAHSAESTPMPTMGNTCWVGEEENNSVTKPVVVVNFHQLMNEVEATKKSVYSCINDKTIMITDV